MYLLVKRTPPLVRGEWMLGYTVGEGVEGKVLRTVRGEREARAAGTRTWGPRASGQPGTANV